MSAITAELVPERDVTYGRRPLSHLVIDVWVLTKRSIARIRREPETLADVTIQPVIFILMFAYVFGGAILLPGGGNYHEYLIGGMLGMGLTQTAGPRAWPRPCRRPGRPALRSGVAHSPHSSHPKFSGCDSVVTLSGSMPRPRLDPG